MAIGIDDLDFYEEEPTVTQPQGGEEPSQEPPAQEPPKTEEPQTPPPAGGAVTPPPSNNGEGEDDIITTLLKEKGIKDSSKIKFEGDDGNTEERDWKDLSREEQLNILRQSTVAPSTEEPENDLSDEEIEFLNMLRTNNLTPQEYLSQLNREPEPVYTVDELSDEDLFVLDLQARVEGITEEQLAKALENAKQDEALFKKQIEGIRKEYKDLEDQNKQQQELFAQQQQEEQYQRFSNTITEQIDKLTSIAGLDVELEKDDKEELADFILGRDETGVSNLGKVLNDPESLVLMSWYALNGDKMIDDITTMYENAIKKARQEAYNKGVEDGKKGIQPGHVVVTSPPTEKPNQQTEKISSIEDLDF